MRNNYRRRNAAAHALSRREDGQAEARGNEVSKSVEGVHAMPRRGNISTYYCLSNCSAFVNSGWKAPESSASLPPCGGLRRLQLFDSIGLLNGPCC